MEVPRLGFKLELELPAYPTATATQDSNRICDLQHSSWQHWILNPLSEARDPTYILMDTSWAPNLLSHNGTSSLEYLDSASSLGRNAPGFWDQEAGSCLLTQVPRAHAGLGLVI